MSSKTKFTVACVVALLSSAPFMAGADEAATSTTPVDNSKMGHSPASKEMRMMDRTAPRGTASETPSAPDNGMGHSPASKEMQMMGRDRQPSTEAAPDGGEHNMMGHSPADAQGMRSMKDKHPKVHTSHSAGPEKDNKSEAAKPSSP